MTLFSPMEVLAIVFALLLGVVAVVFFIAWHVRDAMGEDKVEEIITTQKRERRNLTIMFERIEHEK